MGVHRPSASAAAVLILILLLGAQYGIADAQTLPETPLEIVTPEHRHGFTVEVARTGDERARGLMYRSDLAPDRGMLFDFGSEQMVSMWMRNTLISLDMLFIDAGGGIRKIAAGTEPLSLETISSEVPVLAVLELRAGTTRLLGIRPGDRVLHPIFQSAAEPDGVPDGDGARARVTTPTSRTPE